MTQVVRIGEGTDGIHVELLERAEVPPGREGDGPAEVLLAAPRAEDELEAAADAELSQLLAAARDEIAARPAGGLLFTCNGRGTRMFSQPHHDAQAVAKSLGDIPLAGFFAQGELGPVGNSNFIHGFTASIGLILPAV